jgi:hypothetical protein
MTEQNIRVGVRFRALTASERERGETESWHLDEKTSTVTQVLSTASASASAASNANTTGFGAGAASATTSASSKAAPLQFRFNGDVFGADACNTRVYTTMCKDIISSGMRGINGTHCHVSTALF